MQETISFLKFTRLYIVYFQKDVRVLNYAPGPLDTEMYDDIRRNSASANVKQMFQNMKDTVK